MVFLKLCFLFLLVWQLAIIIVRTCLKLGVTIFSFLAFALGVTGFIYLQFLR